MKHLLTACALSLALAAGSALAAQPSVSASVGLKSNGFFRGLSVTEDKPMMFGAVNYALPNGLYAFGKGNNIAGGGEVDLGGGLKRQIGRLNLDAGVISYNFSNRERIDEVYLSAGMGLVNAAFATNQSTHYLQVNAGHALRHDMGLAVHLGNTLPRNGGNAFLDAGLNLTKSFKTFNLAGEVVHSTAAQVGGTKVSVGISRDLKI